ncbi:Pentatricopeptide repeat-containing protein [Canna indica]|uniref:Pentatricopeptide repeat-containing protein n=1 Tax=Canna indica TaxID=4628 RepID=A0AAQ3KH06_9LILI|nr:Pentatricopeptide repeat-containing protein [Canna indica]
MIIALPAPSTYAAAVLYGLHAHVVVATTILDAYSKCGDLYSSRKLGADEYTVASSLTACPRISNMWTSSQIHGYVVRVGFGMDHAMISALTNMYFRCRDVGSADNAMKGRENLCLSTTIMMIKGYVAYGRYSDVIFLDCSILVSILIVSTHLRLLRLEKQVHGQIIRLGSCGYYSSLSNGNNTVLWSGLIDMYCKCSSIMDAQLVFDSIQEKHVACWNTLITGYIHNGLLEEAQWVTTGGAEIAGKSVQ